MFFLNFQNVWQTKCPEEMVKHICLEIPHSANVDNPIKDAAFLARIGAERLGTNWLGTKCELINAATGTVFTLSQLNGIGAHLWVIRLGEGNDA